MITTLFFSCGRHLVRFLSLRFFAACFAYFAAGGVPFAISADWIEQAPAHRHRVLPEAGALLAHTPPIFFWPAMGSGARYTVSVADAQGRRVEKSVQDNFLVWPSALSDGDYTWQVEAHMGAQQQISAQRSFSIAPNSRYLGNVDTLSVLDEIMGRERPRFFPRGISWENISRLLSGERREIVALIVKRASSAAYDEKVVRLSAQQSLSPQDRLTFKREATKMATAMEDYAFLWRFTQNPMWKVKITETLSVIAAIDQSALYSDPSDLLTARFLLWAKIIAYDWGGGL